jgi:hypothetical protein
MYGGTGEKAAENGASGGPVGKGDEKHMHLFTRLPCAQDTGGENPYIDPNDV